MTAPRIAITGAAGRMGRTLVQALADHPQAELAAALEHPDSPHLGADSGQLAGLAANGVEITAAAWEEGAALPAFDVLVDFSTPAATLAAVAACRRARRALVIGTTGIDAGGLAAIDAAAAEIPLVMAPNYAVGVNLLLDLVASAARVLGDEADVEVIEAHHRHKVDAPSGTALRLGEVLADALDRDLGRDGVFARHGITGARERRHIGFSTVRGGDIVGDHTVLFAADGERLELTHRASSRLTFARGAVRAAAWLHGRPAGRYGMREVLFGAA